MTDCLHFDLQCSRPTYVLYVQEVVQFIWERTLPIKNRSLILGHTVRSSIYLYSAVTTAELMSDRYDRSTTIPLSRSPVMTAMLLYNMFNSQM